MATNSIEKIYDEYFTIIQDHYGRHLKNGDPFKSIDNLLSKPLTSRILYQTSDTIVGEISKLLSKNSDRILGDIKSLSGIKCNFAGGFAPKDAEKFLCKSGLYVDTTVISDPLTFIQTMKSIVNKEEFSRLLFSYSFNMLKLKNALINDCEMPLLRIIPHPIFIKSIKDDKDEVEKETLAYFNDLFSKNVGSFQDLQKVLSKFKDSKDIEASIKNKELLIPSIKDFGSISEGINDLFEDSKSRGFPIKSCSDALFSNVFGSIRGNLSHLNFGKDFGLISSYESPNTWAYFEWMLKHQSHKISKETLALNSITLDKVKWFGNLDIEKIVKAREKSCLQDFREVINRELYYKDEDKTLTEISNQINYNLENEFKKHEKKLKTIESDFNFSYGASTMGIVGGSISLLTGLFTQSIIASFGGGVAIGGSLFSWVKSVKDYNKKEKIINSPIGLLFNTRGDKK